MYSTRISGTKWPILVQVQNGIVLFIVVLLKLISSCVRACSYSLVSIFHPFFHSSRMVGLVQILLKSNEASSLVEDYAACLELRSVECQTIENSSDDPGVLIMQVSSGCFFSWL